MKSQFQLKRDISDGGHFQQNDEETVRVQFCFTSTRDRERPRTATSNFTQFLRFEWTGLEFSVALRPQKP